MTDIQHTKLSSHVSIEDRSVLEKVWIQIAILLIAFGLLYAPVFSGLIQAWWDSTVYRHGFLVPFISLYLAWLNRGRLRQLQVAPSYQLGIPLMILAGLMLLLGKLGVDIDVLQQTSLMGMIVGLILLLLGTAHLKVLMLPIAYLFFMIPVFPDGDGSIYWPFQLLAANIGVWFLQSLGFAAFQEAQYIVLPQITLEVAQACSGIRLMISVAALGIPLAYLTQRTRLRMVGLVAFAITIGIFSNGFRVAAIGVWAYFGGEVVHGPFHVLQGVFVAWIGYFALGVGAWFLSRRPLA